MEAIERSGFYQNDLGQSFLVTQGLAGYTLVTKKKILFRIFTGESNFSDINLILAVITYRTGSLTLTTRSFLISKDSFIVEMSAPNGPSIGILFTGKAFPYHYPVFYKIDFYAVSTSSYSTRLRLLTIPELKFRPSGRLRMLIHPVVGIPDWPNPSKIEPNITWLIDIFEALERFVAMLPVWDDIGLSLSNQSAGLCWTIGKQLDAWPQICPSGNPPPCTSV